MKTIPVKGTGESITFFEDDTIETVRQMVALAAKSHPDRLFLQVKGTFPKEYYADNPLHWMDLFFRLSYDGKVIPQEILQVYVTYIRPIPGFAVRAVTKQEWESRDESLKLLFDPDTDFDELRILGVPEAKSLVLPIPPREVAVPAARIPIPQAQSVFETHHSYEITEFVGVDVDPAMSETTKRVYFPFFTPETPNNIESLRTSIQAAHNQLDTLLKLDAPKPEQLSVIRAKWYIPFLSTDFPAPRTRFEQIFYGMTVDKDVTPYIGYFTTGLQTMRHKLYVEDPKTKEPELDTMMLKGWLAHTKPVRQRPTLLLYRGKASNHFDRISITERDITVSVFRPKASKESLEDLQLHVENWLKTLDALLPFVKATDLDRSRWELNDMSVVATYPREIREFDMLRFPCLQTLFGFQNDTFRLLRTEAMTTGVSPRDLQVAQLLTQEDAEQTPEYLMQQLNVTQDEATQLLARFVEQSEDVNLERSLRTYPTVKFSNKEVILKFATSLDRTLDYANILRYVLTSDAEEVNRVCPRRMEKVAATTVAIQQDIDVEGEYNPNDELNALLNYQEEEEEQEEEKKEEEPKGKKLKVGQRVTRTYNYFNDRLQSFDPDTFDKSIYPNKCEKKKQVVVLTPKDEADLLATNDQEYAYKRPSPDKMLELKDKDGLAICPPYWCMKDEIPLFEDDLTMGDDGELRCPRCKGKVRTTDNLDTLEYPVIVRDVASKYPDYVTKYTSSINQHKMPCCYQRPRSETVVLQPKEDELYILREDSRTILAKRLAFLSPDLLKNLDLPSNYEDSVKKGRLSSGKGDVFRVGLGRPSKTLPVYFKVDKDIPRPKDAVEQLKRCSFFATWPTGDVVANIDAAYQAGELSILQELEYVTTFLKCEVIFVHSDTNDVSCGFWSETVGANSRTIALIDEDILAYVSRPKKAGKPVYDVDLRESYFAATLSKLRTLHAKACSGNRITLRDAQQEIDHAIERVKEQLAKEESNEKQAVLHALGSPQVVRDPFDRIQAMFVPGQLFFPIQPTSDAPPSGAPLTTYMNIKEEDLPTKERARSYLDRATNPMFHVRTELHDVRGRITELLLQSGFRVPVRPETLETKGLPANEVLTTFVNKRHDERTLITGQPDTRLAEETTYKSEIYEFLMFSLSKDLQIDDYADLRESIQQSAPTAEKKTQKKAMLYKLLDAWFKDRAYEDTKTEINFINKVRAPCGQYDKNPDACNKSTLCAIVGDTCKIRVKPIIDKATLLRRMVKTLCDNEKQRALVLDGRMSPFFSTILYLELPNEWITNVL
jgi:hypothetical protein